MSTPSVALAAPRAGWRAWISPEAAARILAGIAILAIWEFTVWMWAPAFVARPSRIAVVFPTVIMDPALWQAAGGTLGAVVQGLAIAIVAGTGIGLAIGRVPVVGEGDRIEVRPRMKLTLSCDHRVIDGAVGAAFLAALKAAFENPVQALL